MKEAERVLQFSEAQASGMVVEFGSEEDADLFVDELVSLDICTAEPEVTRKGTMYFVTCSFKSGTSGKEMEYVREFVHDLDGTVKS